MTVYSKNILSESVWQALDESTQQHLSQWDEVAVLVNENAYLFETDLTLQQIQQLFQNAEKYAIGSDEFKTGTGKALSGAAAAAKAATGGLKLGVDVVRKISAKIDALAKEAAQNSQPVQNADAAFKKAQMDLYDKLGGRDAKINQIITQMAQFAKDNPVKTRFLIGAITTAAAIAAGPVAGAGAGFVLRTASGVLKGDSLSSAVGQAAKVGATGALIGTIADMIGGDVEITKPAEEGGPAPVSSEVSTQEISQETNTPVEDVVANLPDTVEEYKALHAQKIIDSLGRQFSDTWSDEMKQKLIDQIQVTGEYPDDFNANWSGNIYGGNIVMSPEEEVAWKRWVQANNPVMGVADSESQAWLAQNVEGVDANQEMQAAKQAEWQAERKAEYDALSPEEQRAYDERAREAMDMWGDSADYEPPGTPKYTESVIYTKMLAGLALTETERKLVKEIGWQDIKRGAQKAGDAIAKGYNTAKATTGKAASAVGKELGQKITYKQLSSQWAAAGKPLDNAAIFKMLMDAGLDNTAIMAIADASKIPIPTAQEIAAYKKKGGGQTNAKQGFGSRIARAVTGGGNELDKRANAHAKGMAAMQAQQDTPQ